ncbi:MAG TPA: alpha/beta hydrolase [Flavipsychrobacter sp.]|nr:alpha/beta hydrolase [Flavipsychrobacter sp.]
MQHLLLLHGAIGASDQLQPLAHLLEENYKVHTLNFSGHGGSELPAEPFSIKQFASDVIHFLDEERIEKVQLFGYSMGGYVGMYLAKNFPERVSKVATLATKFYWDSATAAKEVQMLNAEKIETKLPAFAEVLNQRHAPNDWKDVLQKTVGMLEELGRNNTLKSEDYTTIQTPVLVLLGDRDKMVTLEETMNVYKALPNAQMGILPKTHHPIEQTNIEALAFLLKQFLNS